MQMMKHGTTYRISAYQLEQILVWRHENPSKHWSPKEFGWVFQDWMRLPDKVDTRLCVLYLDLD